jgi:DNA-binding IclR family transcriptional regulator
MWFLATRRLSVPAQHHRAVDRIASVLEHVAREPGGLTLTDLAKLIGAPKSSLQGLVYGLVASGYLSEHEKRYSLGAAPFILSLMSNPVAARGIRHEALVELQERLGMDIVLAVQVGDSYVALDQAAAGDARLDFASRTHRRGPLLRAAKGKVILANLPDDEMRTFLVSAGRNDPDGVNDFLSEVNEIRATGLAFNRGNTSLSEVYCVAAPLFDEQRRFIASVGASGDVSIEPELPEIGQRLLSELRRLDLFGKKPSALAS